MLPPLDECGQLLAVNASAINMAFTANLAVALWAVLRQRFQGQRAKLSEAADEFARNESLGEVLAIGRLRNIIIWGLGTANVLWWVGLWAGLLAALFLYVLRWHGDVLFLWNDISLCRWDALLVAAYTSPTIMTLMTVVGLEGNRRAENLRSNLQERAEELKEEEQVREALLPTALQSYRDVIRKIRTDDEDEDQI